MPKRMLHVLTLASAVICLGSLVWVGRSLARLDDATFSFAGGTIYNAYTIDGRLVVTRRNLITPRYFAYRSDPASLYRQGLRMSWEETPGLGIRWERFSRDGFFLGLPLWLLPIVCAIPPVRWWRG